MWCALAGVLLVCALAVLVDALVAVRVLGVELAVLAVVRLVAPPPGPVGVTARSKAFDVVFLAVAALAVLALSLAPNIAPA
ncbi:conserved hypothetical protein [Beutenbergia cavernae DSM 12333]|uniref:DUF3017 domain-containing protein n=2 Tax=Beutenbergia TaxID=84756 RepID=C5BZS4_BEUC1|nr:conserved hypothetical protein [Beutenbergia cavernae DSM 12333]